MGITPKGHVVEFHNFYHNLKVNYIILYAAEKSKLVLKI